MTDKRVAIHIHRGTRPIWPRLYQCKRCSTCGPYSEDDMLTHLMATHWRGRCSTLSKAEAYMAIRQADTEATP